MVGNGTKKLKSKLETGNWKSERAVIASRLMAQKIDRGWRIDSSETGNYAAANTSSLQNGAVIRLSGSLIFRKC
jgi:hypothetical protein